MEKILMVVVAYLLTGVGCILRDFRMPFGLRPTYARHPSRYLMGFLLVMLLWLPLTLKLAIESRHWKEVKPAATSLVTFVLLAASGILML